MRHKMKGGPWSAERRRTNIENRNHPRNPTYGDSLCYGAADLSAQSVQFSRSAKTVRDQAKGTPMAPKNGQGV